MPTCHYWPALSGEDELHDPAATGMDPAYAARSATGQYRATPLRALWQHDPYFHDGSAASLVEVVRLQIQERLTEQIADGPVRRLLGDPADF